MILGPPGRVLNCPKRFQTLFQSTSITTLSPSAEVQGPPGAQGETGPQGPQGLPGDTGPQGSTTTFVTVIGESANDSSSPKIVEAVCPSGTVLLSGWGSVDNGQLIPVNGVAIGYQFPKLIGQGFVVQAFEAVSTSSSWLVRAVAVCRSAN